MEETVKQRLVKYLRFKGIGQNKFENMAGIGNGYISNLKNAPGLGHLTKILNAAPDLNERWLTTGEGDMIKTGTTGDEPRMDVTVDKDTLIRLMLHSLKMNEMENEQIRKEMDVLLKRIKELEEEVRETKKDDAKLSPSPSANNQQDKNKVS